jgi:hypothetical protein
MKTNHLFASAAAALLLACGPAPSDPSRAVEAADVATSSGELRPGQVEKNATSSVAKGFWTNHPPLEVAPGSPLDVEMTGTGDPDLYLSFERAPDHNRWDCRPNVNGATEKCSITVPPGRTQVFLSVYGYENSPSYSLRVAHVPKAPVQEEDFTLYVVRGVEVLRDGGTIVLDGYVNRSTDAVVRLDRGLNSATHGQFFVKVTVWPEPSRAERAMTAKERAQLKKSLQEYVASEPNADPAIDELIARL